MVVILNFLVVLIVVIMLYESELFLYGYSYADIKNYYVNKNLNEKLSVEFSPQLKSPLISTGQPTNVVKEL